MKPAICLAAALLAGCSSMSSWSPSSWSHGSWLDAVGKPPTPRPIMSDEQAGALQQEAARLRGQSDAVRARLAGERDRLQRFRHYDELRAVGERLAPIERSLRDAGRPVGPPAPPPPAA
ncbi:MAG: hypothetical protein Q8R01_09805 [Ramlibacter sp.]|nr:hypothetical protein [Ramlibacter sp.]